MLREIQRPVASPALAALIPADVPTRPRALAVLAGVLSGRVWTDDADDPSTVLVIEDADGTTWAGGPVSPADAREALAGVETAASDLIFGFSSPDDPLRELVPGEPYWSGQAIDFTERVPPADEERRLREPTLPDGAELVRLDRETLPLTEWYPDTVHAFGSVERWERHGLGFAVMLDGAVIAECVAGPRIDGLLEMGVTTREAHRGLGLGTLVSTAVAHAAEEGGDRVWWNANARNQPSLAIARRIGFIHERRYDLVALHAPLGRVPGDGV